MAKPHLTIATMLVSFCLKSLVSAYEGVAPPPAIFIFGDSTVDVGTNSLLHGAGARANFPPNGIDFPYSVPTGRFSNGLNSADHIAKLFGYHKSPPSFLYAVEHKSTFKRDILQGVNFASGGCGILKDTGKKKWGNVESLGNQIQQFAKVCASMAELLSRNTTGTLLSKSLFVISIGSNDLFEFADSFPNATAIVKAVYMKKILVTYQNHLKELYKLGARKFGIISAPPIGCCPAVRAQSNDPSVCVGRLNDLAQLFFKETQIMMKKLSSDLKGMNYSLGNAYEMTMSIIQDPFAFGFKDVQSACCWSGEKNGDGPCCVLFDPKLCSNRREFLFWDYYHPTEFASQLAARSLYGAGTRFMTPMNFSQLVAI